MEREIVVLCFDYCGKPRVPYRISNTEFPASRAMGLGRRLSHHTSSQWHPFVRARRKNKKHIFHFSGMCLFCQRARSPSCFVF